MEADIENLKSEVRKLKHMFRSLLEEEIEAAVGCYGKQNGITLWKERMAKSNSKWRKTSSGRLESRTTSHADTKETNGRGKSLKRLTKKTTKGVPPLIKMAERKQSYYSCKTCEKVFVDLMTLNKHTESHKRDSDKDFGQFSCPLCSKEFETLTSFSIHLRWHEKKPNAACLVCKNVFKNIEDLTIHHHKEHFPISGPSMKMLESTILTKSANHKCSYCSQEFSQIKVYSEHVLQHLVDLHGGPHILLSCPVCDCTFIMISGLISHLKYHPKMNTFCQKCNENLQNKSSLITHFYQMHFEAPEEIKKFVAETLSTSVVKKKRERTKKVKETGKQPQTVPTTTYTCGTCCAVFTIEAFYKKHLKIHDASEENTRITNRLKPRIRQKDDPFKCLICDEDFESGQALKLHKSRCHTVAEILDVEGNFYTEGELTHCKLYKCTACEENFFLMIALRKHIIESHNDNKELRKEFCFNCSFCEKSFFTEKDLISHLRLHCKNVQCPVCKESYEIHEEYIAHIEESHSDNNGDDKFLKFEGGYLCKICGLTFNEESNIKTHIWKNHPDRPFVCDVCARSFTLERLLNSHKHCHSNATKLMCEECGKQFLRERDLRKHKKIHLNKIKRVPCKECGKTFFNQSSYKSHYTSAHTNEKPYKCPVCYMAFTNAPSLYLHKTVKCESSKAKPRTCPVCDKVCKNYVELAHHKTIIHKFKNKEEDFCLACNKRFKSTSALFAHCTMYHTESRGIVENLTMTCCICDKTLPNKTLIFNHWLTHREEKAFSCEICNVFFKQHCGFIQHRKNCHKDVAKLKVKIDNEMLAQLKKDFDLAHPAAKSLESLPVTTQNSSQSTADSSTNISSNVQNKGSQEGDAVENLPDGDIPEISINQCDRNENTHPLPNNTNSNLQSAQYNGQSTSSSSTLGYIDFSRANVAVVSEKPPPISVDSTLDNVEAVVCDLNNEVTTAINVDAEGRTSQSEFKKNSSNNNDEVDGEDYSCAAGSPMEFYDDDNDYHLEDQKPYIFEKMEFPEDPFPKKLIIEVEKLKEYSCDICHVTFYSSKLYKSHCSSRMHRTVARENRLKESSNKDPKEVKTNVSKEIHSRTENIQKSKRIPKSSRHRVKASDNQKSGSKIKARLDDEEGVSEEECYTCPYCQKKMSSLSEYSTHVRTHRMKMNCLLCTEIFGSSRKLVGHYKNEHNGQMVVNCTICEASYLEYTNALTDHMHYAHKENLDCPTRPKKRVRLYNCDICGEKSSTVDSFRTHLLSHNDDKHKCVHCTEVFKSQRELETHYNEIHSGDMPFKCDECSQQFVMETRLQLHKKEAHPFQFKRDSDGKFTCEVCGARYHRKADFVNHIPIHGPIENRRKFFCEYCGKTFLRIHSLAIHRRLHTGEKPFLCDQCTMAFMSSAALKDHVNFVHSKILTCDICGKSLSTLKYLKIHKKNHENAANSGSQSSKTSSTPRKQKAHTTELHSTEPSSNLLKCDICSKEFNNPNGLQRHSQLHDPERPFGCDECSFRYNFSSNLSLHKKKAHEN